MGKFPTKEEKTQAIEFLCRQYPVWFFEIQAELGGYPLVLERYQIDYLNDDSRFKSSLKTRQAGGSMMVSAAKFWKAATTEFYRCDVMSVNLKEAKYKIKYIKDFYETIPLRWRPQLSIDNTFSIGFHSGTRISEINSVAASSGIRGGSKDVFFDESATLPKFDELYTSAVPAAVRGGKGFEQVFTPLGMSGGAWAIHTNQTSPDGKQPFNIFSRHEFGWWDVSAFTTDIDAAKQKWEVEYNKDVNMQQLLLEEFGNDEFKLLASTLTNEQFLQEFCCQFVDEAASYFPWDLLRAVLHYDHDQEDGKQWLEQWKERPNGVAEVFVGIDFAEGKSGGDSTSIQIIERQTDGQLRHRAHFDLDYRRGYEGLDGQIKFINEEVIPKFKPDRIRVDATGMGIYIAETLVKKHGHLIDPVPFSYQSKEEMVTNLKACFETQKIWLPESYKELLAQTHGIKRTVTASGNWTYAGDKHDDMFWALALACKDLGRAPFVIMGLSSKKKN